MLADIFGSPAFSFVTFLLGLLLGHRFALFRDIRKELNELITPVRAELAAEANNPSPFRRGISRHDADTIAARLHWPARHRFLQACEQYWKAKEDQHQDELGQPLYVNPDAVRDTAQHLRQKIPIR